MCKKNKLNIAFFGDVIGKPGRELLKEEIPKLKERYNLDFILANGENSAGGRGVNEKSSVELLKFGVDYLTLGDHTFYDNSFSSFLDKSNNCIRPYNYPDSAPGKGFATFEFNSYKITILNLIGRVSMGLLVNCPFVAFDNIYEEIEDSDVIIVDFHAEATSEKNAMAYHIGSRASLLVGTHTHVQTADEKIFESGLAYITDLGMCGPYNSVIGMDKDVALFRFSTSRNKHYKIAKGPAMLNGVISKIDLETSKAEKIERIKILEN